MKKEKNLNDIEIIEVIEDENWIHDILNIENIWKLTKGENTKIAIIDTGVNKHEDLKDSIKEGINLIDKNRNIKDENGHGTAIAGIIAGNKTGIAPKSELYIAKVLNKDGLGSMTNILDGITFAINLKVDLLCMSLGSKKELPQILLNRITLAQSKGITIICATGNNGINILDYPAKLNNIISVSGTDENNILAEFSNYNNDVDVLAPAINVVSTYKDGNKYVKMNGTSMSSAIVIGAVALMISYYKSQNIKTTPEQIKHKLIEIRKNKRIPEIINIEKLIKTKNND